MRVLLTTFYDVRCTGLRLLASCLAQNGHDVHLCLIKEHCSKKVKQFPENHYAYQIIDSSGYIIGMCDASPISEKEESLFFEHIEKIAPSVIGFSLRSYLNDIAISLMQKIKEKFPNIKIICGGFGPTLEPKLFAPHVDAVIRGEGEEAIVDVCKAIGNDLPISTIENVSCMVDGKYFETKLRPPCINISTYPFAFTFHDGNDKFALIENDNVTYGDPLNNGRHIASCLDEDASAHAPIALGASGHTCIKIKAMSFPNAD